MTAPVASRLRLGRHEVAVDIWEGGGAAILCLHGIPGWRGTWRQVGARLAGAHRVIAPDLLGFGESSRPEGPFHAPEEAEMALALLDALRVERAHLVGFDFGGPTALVLAGRAPRRVASLTLLATNAFGDTPIPAPLRVAKVPLLGEAFFRLAFGRLGLLAMWRAAAGDRAAFPRRRYAEALNFPQGVASTRRVFQDSLRHLRERYAEPEAALAGLGAPLRVLWGDRDPFFPVAVGERTARVGRGTLRVLPGCGHFVPEERPEEVATEVATLARGS
jgi:pimeloyl-ACP methyl ester carboxylesterase